MPYSVTQAARAVGVSDTTIRQWGRQFADHLSAGANPGRGQTRQYTDEDIGVFATAAILREQLVSYDEIEERIAAGERLEPVGGRPPLDEEEPADEAPPIVEAFAGALQLYERQFAALQAQLQQTQDRLLEAEKRATAAETRLEILTQQARPAREEEAAPVSPGDEPEARPASWRRRLASWLAGEE